MATMIK